MQVLAQIIFWGCALALAHTYILYPVIMRWLARGKQTGQLVFAPDDAGLPFVSVLLSVHNEERVIAEKIASLQQLRYPSGKLRIYIGSDGSDDRTNAIITGSVSGYGAGAFRFFPFQERRGKPPVINDLARKAMEDFSAEAAGSAPGNHCLLLTDASVMMQPDTLYLLVRHFRNDRIGVVDAHMRNIGLRREGISQSENRYLSGEVQLKHWESLAWGMMIGPFGGCYALRADLFEPVPPHSLVDDFWLVFRVLERGFSAINDLEAICYEAATHRVKDEYRRKKRIAAGSFQNLARFRRWVLPPVSRLGFAFFSHKVLRWFGGFFLLGLYFSCAVLAWENQIFRGLFWMISTATAVILIIPFLLTRFSLKPWAPVKNLAYFLAMNAALVDGFFKWWRGIRENTWNRTARE